MLNPPEKLIRSTLEFLNHAQIQPCCLQGRSFPLQMHFTALHAACRYNGWTSLGNHINDQHHGGKEIPPMQAAPLDPASLCNNSGHPKDNVYQCVYIYIYIYTYMIHNVFIESDRGDRNINPVGALAVLPVHVKLSRIPIRTRFELVHTPTSVLP
jgi:hypothetical protein